MVRDLVDFLGPEIVDHATPRTIALSGQSRLEFYAASGVMTASRRFARAGTMRPRQGAARFFIWCSDPRQLCDRVRQLCPL